MTATGHIRGHVVDWTGDRYVYRDTGEPAEGWGGAARPCPKCGHKPLSEGYDACIGFLPGLRSACCGHGVTKPIRVFQHDHASG